MRCPGRSTWCWEPPGRRSAGGDIAAVAVTWCCDSRRGAPTGHEQVLPLLRICEPTACCGFGIYFPLEIRGIKFSIPEERSGL